MKTNHMAPAWLVLLSAIAGVFLTIVLVFYHNDPGSTTGVVDYFCGPDKASGCHKVNTSPGSVFLGLPVALYGFLYYAVITVLVLFYLFQKEEDQIFMPVIFWLSVIAIGVDGALFLYSVLALETVCNLCVLTYVATLGILLGAFMAIFKKKGEKVSYWMPDFSAISVLRRSYLVSLLVSLLLVPVLATAIYSFSGTGNSARAENPDRADAQKMLKKAFDEFYVKDQQKPVIDLNNSGTPEKGNSDAVVTITEFADPLCPYCGVMGRVLNRVYDKSPDKVRVHFRFFPLDKNCNPGMSRQLHPGACEISYAMYCADKQNKFWQYHDLVFARQKVLSDSGGSISKLLELAGQAGLNKSQLKTCINAGSTKAAIRRDIQAAEKLDIHGTPTLYVNGRRLSGLHPDFIPHYLEYLVIKESEN